MCATLFGFLLPSDWPFIGYLLVWIDALYGYFKMSIKGPYGRARKQHYATTASKYLTCSRAPWANIWYKFYILLWLHLKCLTDFGLVKIDVKRKLMCRICIFCFETAFTKTSANENKCETKSDVTLFKLLLKFDRRFQFGVCIGSTRFDFCFVVTSECAVECMCWP